MNDNPSNPTATDNDDAQIGPGPVRPAPHLWQVFLVALAAIAFTAGWLYLYHVLNQAIWENSYVVDNRWVIVAGVFVFSLVVWVALRFLHSPSVIAGGGFVESIKGGGPPPDYRVFPGTLLSSFGSLLSGVSVGPEGPLAYLVSEIADWIKEKFKISEKSSQGFFVSALASAYNGLVGNPLFTALFATEFHVGGNLGLQFLVWNLVGGVVGYLFFTLLKLTTFAGFLPFAPLSGIKIEYIGIAILMGLAGVIIALAFQIVLQAWGKVMGLVYKISKNSSLVRLMVAAAITGLVCYFYPEIQFSGEDQIKEIVSNPAVYGAGMLLLFALLKILMLGLAFKSGYVGGPIFPTLFTCAMIGLALGLTFPSIPVSIFITCIEAATIAVVLGVPLSAVLVVFVINSGDQYSVALLVIAVVTAMIFGAQLKRFMSQRKEESHHEPAITEQST